MMTVKELLKKYDLLDLHTEADLDLKLTSLASENSPSQNSLVFISKPDSLEKALKMGAGCLVVPETHAKLIPPGLRANILTSPQSRVVMALSSKEVFAKDKLAEQFEGFQSEISMAAIVHPLAHVGEGVKIGPNVFVGKEVLIDDGTLVGTSAVIQSGAKIGKNCRIHEFAYIGKDSVIGDHCEVLPHAAIGTEGFGYASTNTGEHHPIPHQGKVVLGKSVCIGSGTKIDRGTFDETRIGDHTKIDNLCHIAHNCVIGKSALITAGFIIAGSTTIGDNFVTGGGVVVGGHLKITDNVYLAGKSVVHKSITQPGQYYGYPLKPLKEGLKNNAAFGHLAEMKKTLSKVVKHLGLEI